MRKVACAPVAVTKCMYVPESSSSLLSFFDRHLPEELRSSRAGGDQLGRSSANSCQLIAGLDDKPATLETVDLRARRRVTQTMTATRTGPRFKAIVTIPTFQHVTHLQLYFLWLNFFSIGDDRLRAGLSCGRIDLGEEPNGWCDCMVPQDCVLYCSHGPGSYLPRAGR